MRVFTIFTFAFMLALPAASFAQPARGYVVGAGGFTVSPETTSGDWLGEAAVRIAPNLFVIGNVGRFQNLQPSDVQPAVDATTLTLANDGVVVTGTPRMPAWYTTGGLRVQVPAGAHLTPYAYGSVGVAHLTPQATFLYASGTLGDTTPASGDDITPQIVSLGDFTQPASSNALMVSGGGGIQVPMGHRLSADIGYRVSRIAADTPFTTQGMTFGVGYRF